MNQIKMRLSYESDEIKPMGKQRNKSVFLLFMQVEVNWVRNSWVILLLHDRKCNRLNITAWEMMNELYHR